jgi:hypothetical protein
MSGRAAVIVMDNATKDIAALDRASVMGLAVGDGGALVNALMRASNVVIAVGELAHHPLQRGIIGDEEMIEAFLSGGTDPAFREGIRIRSPKGDGKNVEALADEDGIESIREFSIVVADEESQRGMGFVEVPQDLSGLSCDPGLGGVGGDASQVDATSSDLDEEEHLQGFQPDRFHCKEIASQKLFFVVREEGPPADGAVANERRLDVVSFEDVANGGLGSLTAQLTELTLDLAIAPSGILLGQPENQVFDRLINAGSTASVLGSKGPLAVHQRAMPAEYGFRFEEAQDGAQLIGWFVGHLFQFGCEHGKQHFLGLAGSDGLVLLPKQDIQLLAKDEDFYDFVLFGKTYEADEGKQKREGLRQDKPTQIRLISR